MPEDARNEKVKDLIPLFVTFIGSLYRLFFFIALSMEIGIKSWIFI